MKKPLVFLSLVAVTFTSCSSDESNPMPAPVPVAGPQHGYVSAKFNGETEVFDYIEFTEYNGTLTVAATKDTTSSHGFTIMFTREQLGSDIIGSFFYIEDGQSRPFTFSTLTTVNSKRILKGKFSGAIEYYDQQLGQQIEIEVTDGIYDIGY